MLLLATFQLMKRQLLTTCSVAPWLAEEGPTHACTRPRSWHLHFQSSAFTLLLLILQIFVQEGFFRVTATAAATASFFFTFFLENEDGM